MVNEISKTNKNKSETILFSGFIFFYSFIIISLAYLYNIWEDEAFSLRTSSFDLKSVIKLSYDFEGQPPVYFIVLSIWRLINPSVFFARILSLIFIGLGSFYFYKLATLIAGKKISKWIVILFLLNPFTIWAALEIRLYAFAILLSIIIIYTFLKYQKERQKKHLIIFLTVSIIAIYTQYFFTIQIAALALSVLILRGWKEFYKISIWIALIAILFLPNFYYLSNQMEMIKSEKLNYTFFSQVKSIFHSPQDFVLALNLIRLDRWLSILIRIILLFLLYFSYLKIKRKDFNSILSKFLLLTTIFLFIFYSLIFGIFGFLFQLKYLALLFPLILIFLLLFESYKEGTKNFIYFIIAIFYLIIDIQNFSTPIKLYDYKSISNYIEKTEKKDESIVFYRKDIVLPFEVYYKGGNLLEPLVPFNFGPDYYKNDLKDTLELKNHLNKQFTNSKSLLLLTNRIESFIYPSQMNQKIFDSFINCHYEITLDTTFLRTNPLHFIRVRRLINNTIY